MRALKYIRNVVLSIVVLLVVLVGGGVAYTWYVGQQPVDDTAAVVEPVETKSAPVIEPKKPAANARIGASVQTLTSPVNPGSNASITVKTLATATCTIKVTYDEVPSKDSGLKPKVADDFGMVSWTWTVEKTVPTGEWPADVTCKYNKKSAEVQGKLKVVAPKA